MNVSTKMVPSKKGAMGSLLLLLGVLIALILGSLGVDFMHILAVKEELQNATDAGALAGARELWFHLENAEPYALQVTAQNQADGRPVSNSSEGTHVVCTVTAPQGNTPGEVQVEATMRTRHILAPIFLRGSDEVRVLSVAGTSGQLWLLNANQAFPIAVSIDAVPSTKTGINAKPLSQCSLGDEFTIYLGSQKVKNGCFTTFDSSPSAHYLNEAIAQALEFRDRVPGFIPAIKVGDQINLDNGISGQKKLADSPFLTALQSKGPLVLPVIAGDPAFNQSGAVIAFIGFKVLSVDVNGKSGVVESIRGQLVRPQVAGESGPLPTTGTPVNEAISRLNLGPVKLIR